MHNLALVVDEVLQRQRRADHLTTGAEVVELTARQGQYGHAELSQFRVVDERVGAQRTAELAIEVVLAIAAFLHQQLHSPIGEQPHADVGQVVVVALQLIQRLDAGFLQHLFQHVGRLAATDEDAVVRGTRGVEPQSVAHHVGLGNGLQLSRGPYVDVAADHHRVDALRSHRHQPFVERQLQVKQRLVNALPALPAEHGYGHEHLSLYGIAWQAPALSASMYEDAFLLRQPLLIKFTFPFSLFP